MKMHLTEERLHIFQALLLFPHMNKQYVKNSKIDHKDVCIMHCNFFLKYFFFLVIRTSEASISLVQQIVKINIYSFILPHGISFIICEMCKMKMWCPLSPVIKDFQNNRYKSLNAALSSPFWAWGPMWLNRLHPCEAHPAPTKLWARPWTTMMNQSDVACALPLEFIDERSGGNNHIKLDEEWDKGSSASSRSSLISGQWKTP